MFSEIPQTKSTSLEFGGINLTGIARSDWVAEDVATMFDLPLNDLLYGAQWVHRQHFDPAAIQVSTLLSIKTGGCPEDCAYCPQSARYSTGVEAQCLMSLDEVTRAAREAKTAGATRFCMGAAYRGPKDAQVERIAEMISEVKALGLETCATLGLLTVAQAEKLACAGLDFYNHNLDTSESFYPEIISTRTYSDRLRTLEHVRAAGMKVCCGGIVGMGRVVATESPFCIRLHLSSRSRKVCPSTSWCRSQEHRWRIRTRSIVWNLSVPWQSRVFSCLAPMFAYQQVETSSAMSYRRFALRQARIPSSTAMSY